LTARIWQSGRGYNAFWIDPGSSYANVKGTWRTSWIVDPPNGQVPMKRGVSAANGVRPRASAPGYDQPGRAQPQRALHHPRHVGPADRQLPVQQQPSQITQSPDHVVIESEMIHDARIIPLNAKHKPKELTPWMGDSIGWWEGDTLVVETINMHARRFGRLALSPSGKITERFTRYNDKQVFYEFEVDDPTIYSQVVEGPDGAERGQDGIYEYACHEGNLRPARHSRRWPQERPRRPQHLRVKATASKAERHRTVTPLTDPPLRRFASFTSARAGNMRYPAPACDDPGFCNTPVERS
jgi:hypothetical protein